MAINGIPRFDDHDDWNSPVDSGVKHVDTIANGASVSKCLTCKNYCKKCDKAEITTVSGGRMPWHVGANYCTRLGYYPNRIMYPISLDSPTALNIG